ncbi:hypothetical protein CSKR_105768 [Clonorchis sinensis]|uniref:Uncharacterized protein n=1 Tax=Clonorchis sinensis TaxID=79923 RepID=A0A419PZ00_CLOSI|nr:hypothetical protein CSKR_105768 [Clonorchis sinensis]
MQRDQFIYRGLPDPDENIIFRVTTGTDTVATSNGSSASNRLGFEPTQSCSITLHSSDVKRMLNHEVELFRVFEIVCTHTPSCPKGASSAYSISRPLSLVVSLTAAFPVSVDIGYGCFPEQKLSPSPELSMSTRALGLSLGTSVFGV